MYSTVLLGISSREAVLRVAVDAEIAGIPRLMAFQLGGSSFVGDRANPVGVLRPDGVLLAFRCVDWEKACLRAGVCRCYGFSWTSMGMYVPLPIAEEFFAGLGYAYGVWQVGNSG
jgi:hypothetical protein